MTKIRLKWFQNIRGRKLPLLLDFLTRNEHDTFNRMTRFEPIVGEFDKIDGYVKCLRFAA